MPKKSKSPPLTALDFVLGELGCERGKVRAALDLGEQVFGLLLHRPIVFALGLEEDMAGAHLLGRRVLLLVVLVVALYVLRAHARALPDAPANR